MTNNPRVTGTEPAIPDNLREFNRRWAEADRAFYRRGNTEPFQLQAPRNGPVRLWDEAPGI